jgi:benzodiazapine receptor
MMTFNRSTLLFGFLAWLGICSIAAIIGAIASIQAHTFYTNLIQPTWAPPAWLFGPVWTTLYIMMAISAWLVWKEGGISQQKSRLILFLTQLSFNALWSWLFFVWHLGGPAFINIIIMIVLISGSILRFWQISKWAAVLLIPYWLWVGFACCLNYAVWQLNPLIL